MSRRNCGEVIRQMKALIPTELESFHSDLDWNIEDASYKAPEETLQWDRTMHTLQKHLPQPTEKWQFEVLSIFTMRTVEELKVMVSE